MIRRSAGAPDETALARCPRKERPIFSFFLTIARALSTLWRGLRDPQFREMLIALIVMLVSGTVFYSAVEKWSVVDSVYFCVMTLATVGYGDLHPTTSFSKIFTILYFFVGAGIFVNFITKLAAQRRHYHLPGHRRHKDDIGKEER